jgi:DNA-binding MarR family transcriptional regulator
MNKVNLEKSVNHHIAISAIMIKRVFFKILNDNKLDITPEQWNVLYYLDKSNGMTIGDLSKITFKDFANMSRIIQKLEHAGFISKERDEIDKRVFKLFITEKGVELNNQLHQCASQSTEVALNGIDDKAREVMVEYLKKVIINTEEYLK